MICEFDNIVDFEGKIDGMLVVKLLFKRVINILF